MNPTTPVPSNAHSVIWASMLSQTKDTPAKGTGICELCEKETNAITKHHLYPRASRSGGPAALLSDQEWNNAVVQLCWPCHCIIHRIIPHDIMASSFNTLELLKNHRGVQSWLSWASDFSIGFLRSLMIQKIKILNGTQEPKARGQFSHLTKPIEQALDNIWREFGGKFPWKKPVDKGNERRHIVLRQEIRKLVRSKDVQQPEIKSVMRQKAEYQEWYAWVYSR